MVAAFLVLCGLLCLQALSSMSLQLAAPASSSAQPQATTGHLPLPILVGSTEPCCWDSYSFPPAKPGHKRCNRRPPNPMPSFLPHYQLQERRDLLSLMLCSQDFHQCLEHRRCPSNYGINFSQFLFFCHKPILLSLDPGCATESHRGHRKASLRGTVSSISFYRLKVMYQVVNGTTGP